jgi:transcriptional regulator with XRE-family HTH domain
MKDKQEYIINLGWVIACIRKNRGMSRVELAEKSNTTPAVIQQIELGNSSPSLQRLDVFAEVLGVEKYVFLYLSSSIRKSPPTDAEMNRSMYYFNATFIEHCKIVYGLTNIDF